MDRPLVSFIVINWNGDSYLAECIQSILLQNYNPTELIIVDNGSTDKSKEIISKYPQIRLISNDRNLGYGPANNQGVREAKGEIIAFINNDVVLDRDWLSIIVPSILSSDNIGMCAGKTLSYFQKDLIDNTGHLLFWDGLNRGRGRMQKDSGQFDSTEHALFPSGSACIFKASVLRQIGTFDEDFFLYGDDAEMGIRGRLAGWECAFAPKAIAYHRYSASSSPYDPIKFFYVERNRFWVLLKYFPLELILISPIFSIARYMFHLLALLKGEGVSGQFAKSHPSKNLLLLWGKAQFSAWKGLPRFWKKRRELMKKFKWSRKRFYQCFLPNRIGLRELTFTP
jgi:GT2 family glycosyltransferase